MRVLFAPDKFAGTLSAVQAAEAMAQGWAKAAPHDTLVLAPVSDGGVGFLDVLSAARPQAQLLAVEVAGPLGEPTPAAVLTDRDPTSPAGGPAAASGALRGYLESATAVGRQLLAAPEPARAATDGVGQLVVAALDAGCEEVVVGCGGTSSTDAGSGLLRALGARLLDADGHDLPPGGLALRALERMDVSGLDRRCAGVLVAATDVDSPLLGVAGAAAVFGPQKGADRELVLALDAALEVFARVARRDLHAAGWPVAKAALAPGAGAGGGLGYALLALGARRVAGFSVVAQAARLVERAGECDLVVTGEGCFDATSLRGKAASGVAGIAAEAGLPCLVLAGSSEVGRREAAAAGIDAVHTAAELAGSAALAAQRPAYWLAAVAERVARQWSR